MICGIMNAHEVGLMSIEELRALIGSEKILFLPPRSSARL